MKSPPTKEKIILLVGLLVRVGHYSCNYLGTINCLLLLVLLGTSSWICTNNFPFIPASTQSEKTFLSSLRAVIFLQPWGRHCPGVTIVTAVTTTTVWSCPLLPAEWEGGRGPRPRPRPRGFPQSVIESCLRSSQTHWLTCLMRKQGGKHETKGYYSFKWWRKAEKQYYFCYHSIMGILLFSV